jgi:hypothetical protein
MHVFGILLNFFRQDCRYQPISHKSCRRGYRNLRHPHSCLGHVFGSVITLNLRGLQDWKHLSQASSLCGACTKCGSIDDGC